MCRGIVIPWLDGKVMDWLDNILCTVKSLQSDPDTYLRQDYEMLVAKTAALQDS